MRLRFIVLGGVSAVGLSLLFGAAWVLSLPAAPDDPTPPPIAEEEADATIASLTPPKRRRPLIAIVGINDASEATDYLMPYGILRCADVADVVALGTEPGPVALYPALKVEPDATVAEFDAQYPEGADYVIVPAMSRDNDPAALRWIRSQAAKGTIVIGVCAGAKVVAAAGLLDDKRATTHWYYLRQLRRKHPKIRYVADRRLVVDNRVATTTGISASMPMSLILVEAIAGQDKAAAVARDLGLTHWNARHDSNAFRFTRRFALTAIGNTLAVWKREQLGIELMPGIDEVSLALVVDSWSRTSRSRAVTFSHSADAKPSRSGIRVLPDRVIASWPTRRLLPAVEWRPAEELDEALHRIADRYGMSTADFVAKQLEYPRSDTAIRKPH
jgi:putative intracellular protease/amidase